MTDSAMFDLMDFTNIIIPREYLNIDLSKYYSITNDPSKLKIVSEFLACVKGDCFQEIRDGLILTSDEYTNEDETKNSYNVVLTFIVKGLDNKQHLVEIVYYPDYKDIESCVYYHDNRNIDKIEEHKFDIINPNDQVSFTLDKDMFSKVALKHFKSVKLFDNITFSTHNGKISV